MKSIFRKFENVFARFTRRKRLAVILCGLLGFLLPCLYWQIQGLSPVPKVHDEFAYLLAADTFAHFRISNPQHQFWQFFEAEHILVTPTYAAKYPPAQGIILALGQVFFGNFAFGIWLGCGLAAASVCWMLQVWTKPRFALLGTLLFIFFYGFVSYWAHTFWGGMAACAGGALFFGAWRRILHKPTILRAILLASGAVILANSRPFEGFIAILPASGWLFCWLWRDRKTLLAERIYKFVLPTATVLILAGSAMLFYNKQITGNALKLPYSLHTQQYLSTPLFIFQPLNVPTIGGNERLRAFDKLFPPPAGSFLTEFSLRFLRLALNFGNSLFPLILFFPLFLCLPALPQNRFLFLAFLSIFLTLAAMSLAVYNGVAHYFAPLVSLQIFLMLEGFRRFRSLKRHSRRFRFLFRLHLILVGGFLAFILQTLFAVELERIYYYRKLFPTTNINGTIFNPQTASGREEVQKRIEKEPGQHLLFIEYAENYTPHDEWVYNGADIDGQKIVWAHSLGATENHKLLDYYAGKRAVWKIFVSWEKIVYEKPEGGN